MIYVPNSLNAYYFIHPEGKRNAEPLIVGAFSNQWLQMLSVVVCLTAALLKPLTKNTEVDLSCPVFFPFWAI